MTASPTENPLLSLGFAVPFDLIRAEHVEPAVRALIKQADLALRVIERQGGPLTYENTFGVLDTATEPLDIAMSVVGHLECVVSTPELRAAYNAVKPDVSAFYAGIPLRPELYSKLLEYAKGEEAGRLDSARRRFIKKTLEDFRRHGAELDVGEKARLEAISRELAQLTARFAQNVLDSTAAFELIVQDEQKLAGLPESAVVAAREGAREKGKEGWRFTLQAPSLIPLLTYLDDRSIREQVWRAYNRRATAGELDNAPLVRRILELRREQAALLGYATFADLVLEDRMAKSGALARKFVEELTQKTRSAFERERGELEEFRQRTGGEAGPIEPWDLAYYAEKQRRALYDFDEEALRPYFVLERAVGGLFETARRLYGVRVEQNTNTVTWHPDVRAYDLYDEDGTFLASFYADFYPRDEKRGGAWMNGLITGVAGPRGSTPHLGLICANVTPPVGGRPSLLTHQEVTTLFHEFGHLLHHCLSRVEVRSLAGTNVAWDFVELPSQIMENWCWQREALDSFARHYEKGDSIPSELFEKMSRARTYREATAMMRQLGFAAVDLALHMAYEEARDGDVLAYARRVMQSYAPVAYPDEYAMIASFSHLFSSHVGYAAGYYSYKWAEVLDADAFTRFRDGGVFNRAVGSEFRHKILARGDSDDPMTLYREFMGREPRLEALLERSGLVPATPNAA